MLFQLLRFEWRYHTRHISFLAFVLFFGLLGFLLSTKGFGEPNLYHNSTYNITKILGLLSLGAIFCMMVLASRVLLRDHQNKMEELIYATPIAKRIFLGSRFIGYFSISVFLFSFSLLGLWLGALLSPETDKIGPLEVGHYLWPFWVLVVPNLFLGGVVLFTIASLTRNVMATYVGGIFLYCLYWVAALFLNSPMMAGATPVSPEGMALAAWLDPFALSAFFEQTQYWEVAQKNAALIALEGHFLYNRVLWVLVGVLILGINYWFFQFRKGVEIRKQAGAIERNEVIGQTALRGGDRISHDQVKWSRGYGQTTLRDRAKILWSNFKVEFGQIMQSWPFRLILLLWMGIVASEILTRIFGGGEYGTSLYPTTNLMIWLYADPYRFLNVLLIIFYAGEIAQRERQLLLHELKDSLPVSNWIFYGSKYLALISIPMLLIGCAILVSLVCQFSKGWFVVEPEQYLASFYLLGLPACLFAVITLFIQTLVPNKYVGMFACLLFALFFNSSLSSSIGIEHPLLKIGAFPKVEYNHMNGYGPALIAFHWMAAFWSSLYLLLGFLTYRLWRRGTVVNLIQRVRHFRGISSRKANVFVILFITLFLTIGGFVYYNINILNHYQSQEASLDQMAAYEKKYQAFSELPELSIIDVKTQVDLFPRKRKYQLKQTFLLENKTGEAISELWFTASALTRVLRFEIEKAHLQNYDSLHQVYWFNLDQPLSPGDRVTMYYDIEDHHQGFKMNSSFREMDIVANGTNLMNSYMMPTFGYSSHLEISDKQERKKRGLSPKEEETDDELHSGGNYHKFTFETTISTDTDQTAIAPGRLIDYHQENGRNIFHYKTDQPINNFYSYFSADYEVKQQDFQGINLEIYYDAQHEFNVNRMMATMQQTLDYCQRSFSPYGINHLRMAEIPAHWPMGGFATSGVIGLVENRAFLTDLRDSTRFDVVAKRVAHEVAHQWFGHQLNPQNVKGASMLVESMAKYIECVIIDQEYGKGQLRTLLQDQMQTYFSGRNRSNKPEPSLDQVEDESFIAYAKGCIVMHALRNLVGEETLNNAIQELLCQHAYPNPRGSAADFVRILKSFSPAETHPQIDDWVSKIVFYDNEIESISYQKSANGQYEVTVIIQAQKMELKANGELETLPFAEEMPLGFFDRHPDQLGPEDKALAMRKPLIKTGVNRLVFTLDQLPQFIALDPFLNLLDKNVVDNVREIK